MNSRDAQDVILRLLADGPFRAQALSGNPAPPDETQALLQKIDMAGLERFARFMCRHYYRERVVHYFKYARALASRTGLYVESVLKTDAFRALAPHLTLGDAASAAGVLKLIEACLLGDDAGAARALVPYWDDLTRYQSTFFLTDARPPEHQPGNHPALAPATRLLELNWDLPAVLPDLLRPFASLPMPAAKPVRLLFARSPQGEVTVLRCPDALKNLLLALDGTRDPAALAASAGLDAASAQKAVQRLAELGAVVAREQFSSAHTGTAAPAAEG